MKKFAIAGGIVVVGLVVAMSCVYGLSGDTPSPKARELVAQGARLLDVRSPEEYAGGHVEGAVNIPIQDLPNQTTEVGPKDQPVVVYCAAGVRSAKAAKILKEAGFASVHDLGAMSNW